MALADMISNVARRIWNAAGLIFGLLVLAAWGMGLTRVQALERASPRAPNIAFGQTTPEHWKGLTVYVTAAQASFIQRVGYFEVAALVVMFAMALWDIRKRLNRARPD